VKWGRKVPVRVYEGDTALATLLSIRENSRARRPLNADERRNAAWALVRLKAYALPVIASAAGVSRATVTRMRKTLRTLEAEGKEITGEWWRDRKEASGDDPSARENQDMDEWEEHEAQPLAERIGPVLGKLSKAPGVVGKALGRVLGNNRHAIVETMLEEMGVDLFVLAQTFAEDPCLSTKEALAAADPLHRETQAAQDEALEPRQF